MSQLEEISQKQINKLGKRFRDSTWSDEDYNFLEDFKKSYDEILINNSSLISKLNENFKIIFSRTIKENKHTRNTKKK